jgi:hypothetical protein
MIAQQMRQQKPTGLRMKRQKLRMQSQSSMTPTRNDVRLVLENDA